MPLIGKKNSPVKIQAFSRPWVFTGLIVEQGQCEVNRGYQPEIKPLKVSLSDYDVIAVGTPKMEYQNCCV